MIKSLKQMHDAWSAFEQAQANMERAATELHAFRGEITDLALLPQLYTWYREVADLHQFRSDVRNGNHKQFVFVALMLYSPMSLCGGKIENGLRREIAGLLHLRSHTILYHMRDKAVMWNRTYATFSSEVEVAYEEIMGRLRGVVE